MRVIAFHRAILLVATAIVIIAALWWKCRFDPAINFLPSDSRAEWIVFPAPVEAGAHRIATIDTAFRREFQLASPPKSAQMQLRAARRIELKINGKPVEVPNTGNWKDVTSIDVAGFLQNGSNKIDARVFNDDAPAALWFRLATDGLQLRSDSSWEASLAGSAWRKAAITTAPRYPRAGNLLVGGETTFAVLPRIWPAWTAFMIAAVLMALFGSRLVGTISAKPSIQTAVIVGIIAVAWIVLFWNNTRLVPFHCGYDSTDHIAYIKYIQEERALPLPTAGYEAFQAPLYYALSAGVLSIARWTVTDAGSPALLRALTMCFGIAHFVIVLGCLRLVFPERPRAQLAGLAVAAFLPMQLYLSHYVTNETLAATLVSAAIYFALSVLKKQGASIWDYAGLGLCSGAAILTKATGLLLIPPLFGALILKMVCDKIAVGAAAQRLAITLMAFLAACGWYYIWIWRHFGTPIVGNWERAFGFNWWQDPGFHTAVHYFRFGRALVDPLFSGYNSFADGIYSTLWGDGLGGGLSDMLSRTPWNYKLMVGGYWLALIPTLFIAIGILVATFRFIRQPSAEWFLLIGFSAAVAVALIFMTLRVASYAQVKAFYGLSALVPLCAFAAIGWEKLERAPRLLRLSVSSLLVMWALNSFFAVWIPNSAATHIYAGRRLITERRLDAAIREAEQALKTEPSNAIAQCFLASVLDEVGQYAAALEPTKRGLEIDPANGFCQLQDVINAVRHGEIEQPMMIAQRTVEAEPENARAYDVWFTCARELRRTDEAMAVARDALANSPYDADLHYRFGLAAGEARDFSTAAPQFAYALLLQPSRTEIEEKLHLALVFAAKSGNAPNQLSAIASTAPDSPILLDELAWLLATNPNSAARNGDEALQLSERACLLTKRTRSKFLATLAAAYAETGRFSDGIATAQQAVSLARMSGDTSASELAEKLLDALQQQRPYREEPAP